MQLQHTHVPFHPAQLLSAAPTLAARLADVTGQVSRRAVPNGPLTSPLLEFEAPTAAVLGRVHATLAALGAVRSDLTLAHDDGRPATASVRSVTMTVGTTTTKRNVTVVWWSCVGWCHPTLSTVPTLMSKKAA